jgi:hypothetical protein
MNTFHIVLPYIKQFEHTSNHLTQRVTRWRNFRQIAATQELFMMDLNTEKKKRLVNLCYGGVLKKIANQDDKVDNY